MKKFFKIFFSVAFGFLTGSILMKIKKFESDCRIQSRCDKFFSYYTMLNLWMKRKQEGRSLADFFIENNYKNIAIYGMGEMGQRLVEDLLPNDINVKYAVDKNMKNSYKNIPIKGANDVMNPVDVMIVTATYDYESIRRTLEDKVSFPILSLNEVVFYLTIKGDVNEKI